MRDPIARPRDPALPLRRVRVGDVEITPLVQLHYRPEPARFFPGIESWGLGADDWHQQAPYIEDGRLVVDMGGFLLRTPKRTVLVDAGIGNDKSRPNSCHAHRRDPWLELLHRAGAAEQDVDDVVFTHLHVDHVGYATTWDGEGWQPTFARARHHVARAELEYWTSGDAAVEVARLGDYVADSVLPVDRAGLLSLVDGSLEVAEEVRIVPAPGHTPGNVCVEVRSRGERGVFAGDMVHAAVQLAFPSSSTDFCIDADEASRARVQLLEGLGADDLLFTAHFPDSMPGRVTPDGAGGYRFARVAGEIV